MGWLGKKFGFGYGMRIGEVFDHMIIDRSRSKSSHQRSYNFRIDFLARTGLVV
jgi:hypothetical protein